jgi:hypothetical protein
MTAAGEMVLRQCNLSLRFVSGHDFSHAERGLIHYRASAPEAREQRRANSEQRKTDNWQLITGNCL